MLLAAVVLKLVPVRVTTSPGLPVMGVKEDMVGCATKTNGKHKAAMAEDK
jgi:hypothetical protein